MTRIPTSPPVIPPVSAAIRPLWSVMIPVYNNYEYLAEALTSVLFQGFNETEMEIEVVDDASTDGDVEALVKKIGQGRIKYFRKEINEGSLRNFETCIQRSRGYLVHLLHADDRVRIGYYKKMNELFTQHPKAGAAFCRFSYVDENGKEMYNQTAESSKDGILENWLYLLAQRQRIQYAAITVKRDVYEKLGSFYGLTYAEDWVMWVRIAKEYSFAYTPEVLADYRKLTMSISGKKILAGDYLSDLNSAMQLIQEHLPENQKKEILKKSKHFYARYALKMANKAWRTFHDSKIVKINIKKSWEMHRNIFSIPTIAKLYLKMILRW